MNSHHVVHLNTGIVMLEMVQDVFSCLAQHIIDVHLIVSHTVPINPLIRLTGLGIHNLAPEACLPGLLITYVIHPTRLSRIAHQILTQVHTHQTKPTQLRSESALSVHTPNFFMFLILLFFRIIPSSSLSSVTDESPGTNHIPVPYRYYFLLCRSLLSIDQGVGQNAI